MAEKGVESSDSEASLPENITQILKDLAEDKIDDNLDKFIGSLKRIMVALEQVFIFKLNK